MTNAQPNGWAFVVCGRSRESDGEVEGPFAVFASYDWTDARWYVPQ